VILTKLEVTSFRNINSISLVPHPSLNLITGDNGSGKSSILESVQCLSTGHSFRTRKARELIRKSSDAFTITALFHDPNTARDHRAGLKRHRDGTVELRLDFEEMNRIAEVTRLLPVKSLTPDSHKLIQEGPDERRAFLDWGVFHVEPTFFPLWQQFKRSLSQRNQLLRDRASLSELKSWDTLFLESANQLDEFRKSYVSSLAVALQNRLTTMHARFHVELSYKSGWSSDFTLAELLVKNVDYHRKMKTTTDGPHRAEMVMMTNDFPAKQTLSRGEQKVLVYLLHLAQLDLLQGKSNRQAVLLCDDLTSELDTEHSQQLIQQLIDLKGQIFVTGVDLSLLQSQKHERFHMINGDAKKVV
jgi:DNA replication and repair protein RecF